MVRRHVFHAGKAAIADAGSGRLPHEVIHLEHEQLFGLAHGAQIGADGENLGAGEGGEVGRMQPGFDDEFAAQRPQRGDQFEQPARGHAGRHFR